MRFQRIPRRVALLLAVLILVVLVIGWTGFVAYSANAAAEHASDLQHTLNGNLEEMTPAQFDEAHVTFEQLNVHLGRLDGATTLPGVGWLIGHTPWIGPRYQTGRELVKFSVVLGDAGERGTAIARDVLAALDEEGITWSDDPGAVSWLRALDAHRDEFPDISANIESATFHRSRIDLDYVPDSIGDRFGQLDELLQLAQTLSGFIDDFEAYYVALGGEGEVHYLILFHNPAELRPSGGFPGTMGLFTLRDGQLVEYTIHDAHELTQAYMRSRSEQRPQPWPIETFFPQAGFIFHDANWYAEFPRSGETLVSMWQEMPFPPLYGVVAVQPQVVSGMLNVTGPLDVDVDGEIRHVTPDNVYDEVERNRRLRLAGIIDDGDWSHHKDILVQIGVTIMEEVKQGSRQDLLDTTRFLRESAEIRDVQVYVVDERIQAQLDAYRYSGRLIPDVETPTLAVTFANLVLRKSSLAVQPYYQLTFEPDGEDYLVTLEILVEHLGRPGESPFYEGFQRWWIEIMIPDAAELVASSRTGMPDPEAPNGGSYVIDLFQENTDGMSVVFRMRDFQELLLRKQPGQPSPLLRFSHPGCEPFDAGFLTRDVLIYLRDGCPVIDEIDPNPRRVLLLS